MKEFLFHDHLNFYLNRLNLNLCSVTRILFNSNSTLAIRTWVSSQSVEKILKNFNERAKQAQRFANY